MVDLPDTIVSGDENQQIFLVKPTYSASGWTFTDQRVLNTTYRYMEWFYLRNGGCGGFRLILKEEMTEQDQAIREGWEVHVRIKLTGETSFTTWYRGIIKSIDKRVSSTEITTEVRGVGYADQLASLQVQRRYPKGQTVNQIVGDILQNYIRPYTRIIQPFLLDTTLDQGLDLSQYVTRGPIHFECSALRAIKFLAELQGSREYGVAANRCFYFRSKQTTFLDALFLEKDVVELTDSGQFYERTNKVKVGGKQFAHREGLSIASDVTDITSYGTFEKTLEVPWVEHELDALRWAENIIAIKKSSFIWKVANWTDVDKRLERSHPNSGLYKIRFYGSDVSSDYDDLDITKIMYIKGSLESRTEVNELAHPKPPSRTKNPLLRAVITAGMHQFNLPEELEDKIINPVEAVKGRMKQHRDPPVDVTHPTSEDFTLQPGMHWAIYPPGATDITNSRLKQTYWNKDKWNDFVGMRDLLATETSDFAGEEGFLYEDVTRSRGYKTYWAGNRWVLYETSKRSVYDVITVPVITATRNDFNFGSAENQEFSNFRLTSDASRTITGILGGVDGRRIKMTNVGSFDIILANQNSGSSAANRIITGGGTDLTITPDDTVQLEYDGSSQRWRVMV